MNLFENYGLSRLINGRGPSTIVGANRVSHEIIEYMKSVLTQPVEMRQLQALASEVISKFTGAEAGCVTGCAAAGVAVAIAAFLTQDDMAKIATLPKPVNSPSNIVIQKAQMISGGGCSIEQLIGISGANIIEVGESADCSLFQLHAALDESVAGAVFVMGSRSNTSGTIPLGTFVKICHEHNVPVVVDAAGESNLKPFIEKGVDLLVVSSQKWLGGPTAGMIAGRADLIHACFLNGEFGIGRPMKAGKESIAGLIGAIETYHDRNDSGKKKRDMMIIEHLHALLDEEPGLKLTIIHAHEESPSTCVLKVNVDPEKAGVTSWDLGERLLNGKPRIAVDAYSAREGHIAVDPGLLEVGEEEIIATRIKEVLAEARETPQPLSEYVPRFETLVARMKDWRNEIPVMNRGSNQ
jgi:L-seryl-tRNA(Ser) seleniumtransferase